MEKVLKFRYFLWLLVITSCGENQEKKETNINSTNVNTTKAVVQDTKDKVILFFGNSLTAAYGLDPKQGFPHLIQLRLDSLALNYKVINSGLSGETTSGGLNRLDWVLNQPIDIFVLELGANDGLRGVPIQKSMENLQEMIDMVKRKNPNIEIILAGMQIPPNMGEDYTEQFRTMYPALAEENKIHLIPFLLKGVAGIPSLNLEDGIHPTANGQKIVAENVWKLLRPIVTNTNETKLETEAISD